MASTDVRRAVDSVGVRDFEGEIAALLHKADEARVAAAEIDLDGAVEATLRRAEMAADAAIMHGAAAAEATMDRIHEQQERFKAGVLADGGSLDEEVPEGRRPKVANSEAAGNMAGNKYAILMNRKKVEQEQQRM